MAFNFSDWVGCYRLVVSAELCDFIERTFVEPVAEQERQRARRAALAEAGSATLEIRADGRLISRSGADVLYESQLSSSGEARETFVVEKPGRQLVTLRLLDPRTLEAVQPGRPPLTFVRSPDVED